MLFLKGTVTSSDERQGNAHGLPVALNAGEGYRLPAEGDAAVEEA